MALETFQQPCEQVQASLLEEQRTYRIEQRTTPRTQPPLDLTAPMFPAAHYTYVHNISRDQQENYLSATSMADSQN